VRFVIKILAVIFAFGVLVFLGWLVTFLNSIFGGFGFG
jgi:hypothetical protein